jgi:hypothetical protein
MKWIISLAFIIVTGTQCARKMYDAPSCIQQKINELKAMTPTNPRARISEYEYDGKKVYLLIKPCCDQYNELYDANCNYVCAPSGGITGKGDGKCPEFDANAKFIKVIWEDKR